MTDIKSFTACACLLWMAFSSPALAEVRYPQSFPVSVPLNTNSAINIYDYPRYESDRRVVTEKKDSKGNLTRIERTTGDNGDWKITRTKTSPDGKVSGTITRGDVTRTGDMKVQTVEINPRRIAELRAPVQPRRISPPAPEKADAPGSETAPPANTVYIRRYDVGEQSGIPARSFRSAANFD